MAGILKHAGLRYFIVRKHQPSTGFYEADVPFKQAEAEKGLLTSPTGSPILDAVVVLESDLWIKSDKIVTIKGWPVFPFWHALFRLPPLLVDTVIANTDVEWTERSSKAIVRVSWDGISLERSFALGPLGVGVAVWPPRVIPEWRDFFLMFAPGSQALLERAGAALFEEREPCVYGFEQSDKDVPTIVEAEARLIGGRMGSFCRIPVPPRWISFRSRVDHDDTHGILPLKFGERGELRMPGREDRKKSVFAHRFEPREARSDDSTWLAVDFGTSNTAVAVGTGVSDIRLLQFGEGSRAVNLTASSSLDPATSALFGLRFFPLSFDYPNPISTILMEFDEAEPFTGSQLFPKRAIPGIRLNDVAAIQRYARDNFLKQDFKWKDSGDGPLHQRAFLEHLALAVAWSLRTRDDTKARSALNVVFTCPLAFNENQTESLNRTVSCFRDALSASGFHRVEVRSLVSESLANLCYVRHQSPKGRDIQSERHVVVDIGGGTTDVSVFTGAGDAILLDSLYIGGKDLAEKLLYYRILYQDRWEPVAKVLGLKERPLNSHDRQWTEMAQCVLISRMAERDGHGISQLAAEFNQESMRDLLGEVALLLVFTTAYAIRMAALSRPEKEIPAASKIWVSYAGLGSRLFDLCPLGRGQMDRWKTAQGVLKRVAQTLPETRDIEILFTRSYGKESVCLGALHSAIRTEKDDVEPLALRTAWWADMQVGASPIAWTQLYKPDVLQSFGDRELAALQTGELFGCFESALRAVGQTTFGSDWVPDEARLKAVEAAFPEHFARACGLIKKRDANAPTHPVRSVTDGIKDDVCELMEP